MLQHERRAEKYYQALQQSPCVKRRKLIRPERPKEKESEHPVQQTALWQHGIEYLRRGEEECDQGEQMREVEECGLFKVEPTMQVYCAGAHEEREQQHRQH